MKQNSLKSKLWLVATAVIMAFSLFFGAYFTTTINTARADELSPSHQWVETVELANADFSASTTSSVPTPENWAGASINNMTVPKAGVVDVVTFAGLSENEKNNYGFDSNVLPLNTYSGATDDKILFINSPDIDTAYGYTSQAMSFNASSYYRISVYVKTVGVGRGASITINGLTNESDALYGITDINTDGSWGKYTIYVKTSAIDATSATITLALGANLDLGESKGVAFFDTVSVTALSSYKFYDETRVGDSETSKVITIDDGETLLPNGNFNQDLSAFGTIAGGQAQIIDATDGANIYGATNIRPAIENQVGNKILAITTGYNDSTDTYNEGYATVKTKDFVIKRFERVRITGWYYSGEAFATDGVNFIVNYKSTLAGNSDEFTASEPTMLSNNANNAHNGWNQFIIYLCGSERCDFIVNIDFSIGTKNNDDGEGVAFFDDIAKASISPATFDERKESGNLHLTFDADPNTENFTNGWMSTITGTYENGKPANPYGWKFTTTNAVTSTGYSKVAVNTDNAVSGIVAIDGDSEVLATKYPQFAGINYGNALLLSSTTPTAYCYESTKQTLTADKYAILTVSLATKDVTGYGANIVLKKDNNVVATIEKITSNGDYSFYIKNGSKDSSITIELWLGLNDRNQNTTKLASGSVYFTRVALNSESTVEAFTPVYESYNANRINEFGVRNVAVSLADEDFMSFDSYDVSSLKYPYNWSLTKGEGEVRYGVFDTQNRGNDNIIPSNYDNGNKRFALVLKNTTSTYSVLKLNNNFNLTTGSFYKLTFSAKVVIPDEYINSDTAKGAFISIGNDYTFEFNKTVNHYGEPTFKTYTFLIKAPEADSTTAISIGLGGKDKINQSTTGILYINSISFESIDSSEYDELTAGLSDGNNLIDEFTMRAPLSTTTTDNNHDDHNHTTAPSGSSAETWWLIPSILIAIAILIAVIGVLVRKFIDSRPKKKEKYPSRASYDRRNLSNDADTTDAIADDSFDKFDDTDDDTDAVEVDSVEIPADAVETAETDDTVTVEETVETAQNDANAHAENIGGGPTENAPSLETNDDDE